MSEVASQVSGQRITVFHPSFYHLPNVEWGFPVAQLIKNSPAMQETLVRFLGWEDPLEKGNTKVYLQFKLRIGSMIIFSSSVLLHRHWYGVNRILDLNKFGICKL